MYWCMLTSFVLLFEFWGACGEFNVHKFRFFHNSSHQENLRAIVSELDDMVHLMNDKNDSPGESDSYDVFDDEALQKAEKEKIRLLKEIGQIKNQLENKGITEAGEMSIFKSKNTFTEMKKKEVGHEVDSEELITAKQYCGRHLKTIKEDDFIKISPDSGYIKEFCRDNSISIAFTLTCQTKTTESKQKRAFDPAVAKTIIVTEEVDFNPYGYVGYFAIGDPEHPEPKGILVDVTKLDKTVGCVTEVLPNSAHFSSTLSYINYKELAENDDCMKLLENDEVFYTGGYGIHEMYKDGKHLFEPNFEKAELLSKLNEKLCFNKCGKITRHGHHLLVDDADGAAMIRQGDFVLIKQTVQSNDPKTSMYVVNAVASETEDPLYWIVRGDVGSSWRGVITLNSVEHQDVRKVLHGWTTAAHKFKALSYGGKAIPDAVAKKTVDADGPVE